MNFEKNFGMSEISGKKPDKSQNKMTRRQFLRKGARLAAAVAVSSAVPETVLAGQKQEHEIGDKEFEEAFYQVVEELNVATELFLEGKRIALQDIKEGLYKLNRGYKGKYSDYVNLINTAASDLGFSIDQVYELLKQDNEIVLRAITEGKTHLEENVWNLEELREGRVRSIDKVIEMAQLYALSNSRGAKNEYGINFIKAIDDNEGDLVTITESLHGRQTSVALDISNELQFDSKQYEKYSLHSHPDEFSFFSIEGDLTYYLSEVRDVEELQNFTALMVDKSGIVWSMQFNQMTNNQLSELKEEDESFINFLIKYGIELEMITNEKIVNLKQYLLEDEFFNKTQQQIENTLSQLTQKISRTSNKKERLELNELRKHLDIFVMDMVNIYEKTRSLRELHTAAVGVFGSREKESYVQNTIAAQEEFKKYGIKIYPRVPGRVQKQWNEKKQ